MFIRLYVNAINEYEVQPILEVFLNKFQPILNSQRVQKIEAYWKMDNVYIVELTLMLLHDINETELNRVLVNIADKWSSFGSPTNELLASETTNGCNYILNGINMINIHLE